MKKMTRPVIKHLAEINFKNWNRIDAIVSGVIGGLDEDGSFTQLENQIVRTMKKLKTIRDDIKVIDETFRDYLEEE